jgi:hypothetical protein
VAISYTKSFNPFSSEEIMSKVKEVPRERFFIAAKEALKKRDYTVLRVRMNPSLIDLEKDGRRLRATLLTLQPGIERFTVNFDETGKISRFEDIDLALFAGTIEMSHFRFWVAALPPEPACAAFAERAQHRLRRGHKPNMPVWAFFDEAPPGTPASQQLGAGFGRHAIWREEISVRIRLQGDDSAHSIASADRRLIVNEIGEATLEPHDDAGAAWRHLRETIAAAAGVPVSAVRLQATIDLT